MKNSKYLLLILISILWSCDPEEPENEKEIIPAIDTIVNAIAIDQNNTKWIGTENGLYKSVVEGYELQNLSLEGKIYSLFYENPGNILWIGTESGLLKASISGDSISDFSIFTEELSNLKVLALNIDQDSRHWFGTRKGISLNYGETWKKDNFRFNSLVELFSMEAENFTVNSIASLDGDYYFATSGARLYRAFGYDPSVDAFSGATQWSIPFNGESVTDTMFVVFIDNEGKQWMGGKEGIQVHTGNDPKNAESFVYYYYELPDYYVLTINQAPNGNMWVGTRNGLAVFNGSDWETITAGLPDLYITSIAFDADGSTWIGTKKGLANIPN